MTTISEAMWYGQAPIISLSIIFGLYITMDYGPLVGLITFSLSMLSGLILFEQWFWGEWPFNRRYEGKMENE